MSVNSKVVEDDKGFLPQVLKWEAIKAVKSCHGGRIKTVWEGELFFQSGIRNRFFITLICQSWDSFISVQQNSEQALCICAQLCTVYWGWGHRLETCLQDGWTHGCAGNQQEQGVAGCSWSGVADVPFPVLLPRLAAPNPARCRDTSGSCPPCPLVWG